MRSSARCPAGASVVSKRAAVCRLTLPMEDRMLTRRSMLFAPALAGRHAAGLGAGLSRGAGDNRGVLPGRRQRRRGDARDRAEAAGAAWQAGRDREPRRRRRRDRDQCRRQGRAGRADASCLRQARLPPIPSSPRSLPFDTLGDLQSVSLIFRTPLVLVVNPNLPAKSVAELVALLKQKPGEIQLRARRSRLGDPSRGRVVPDDDRHQA